MKYKFASLAGAHKIYTMSTRSASQDATAERSRRVPPAPGHFRNLCVSKKRTAAGTTVVELGRKRPREENVFKKTYKILDELEGPLCREERVAKDRYRDKFCKFKKNINNAIAAAVTGPLSAYVQPSAANALFLDGEYARTATTLNREGGVPWRNMLIVNYVEETVNKIKARCPDVGIVQDDMNALMCRGIAPLLSSRSSEDVWSMDEETPSIDQSPHLAQCSWSGIENAATSIDLFYDDQMTHIADTSAKKHKWNVGPRRAANAAFLASDAASSVFVWALTDHCRQSDLPDIIRNPEFEAWSAEVTSRAGMFICYRARYRYTHSCPVFFWLCLVVRSSTATPALARALSERVATTHFTKEGKTAPTGDIIIGETELRDWIGVLNVRELVMKQLESLLTDRCHVDAIPALDFDTATMRRVICEMDYKL